MDKLSKSKESPKRNTDLPKSNKRNSRIGMEEYRKLEEDVKIKGFMFRALNRLNMTDKDTDFQITVQQLFIKHDMSGEEWND